jgi:hypothetical protein
MCVIFDLHALRSPDTVRATNDRFLPDAFTDMFVAKVRGLLGELTLRGNFNREERDCVGEVTLRI